MALCGVVVRAYKVSDSKTRSHLELQQDYHYDLGYVPFLMAKECEEKGSVVWKGVRTRPEQGFFKSVVTISLRRQQ